MKVYFFILCNLIFFNCSAKSNSSTLNIKNNDIENCIIDSKQHTLCFSGDEVALISLALRSNELIQLNKLEKYLSRWSTEERKVVNLHQIINNIKSNKALTIHLTPVIKGRLLYNFIHTGSDIIDWQNATTFIGALTAGQDLHLGKNWLFGIDEAREEAILTILEYGIQSQRDFQETLEHMTPTSCKSNSKTQSCAVALDKANKNKATFDHNFNILRDYLNDWGDSRRLNRWHDKLPISATKVAGKKKLPIARP
ncbi:hypothetical protein [Pleionea mediterranea]|uniref:Uncharacterized protein n=1 Tax=Pleionea mediterranea TaxID=523701 RepID=A0A316F6S0_9GAMM|nr:hypothetical protein [Pleionea mediterranea]PWK41130.1 hypothetical protein C8D97_1243 [Pleionea mediterranea]